jgi:WW domain-binding protein 4
MTEFWKSGERHFCIYCKCWLAGNKLSINLHESGNHHKNNVKAKLDQLRKTSLEKERQTKELNTTLGQMERAANESFCRDAVANVSNSSQQSTPTSGGTNLPSKLKRHIDQPIQVQCKKAKFVIKTPTPKPVFEPIVTPTECKTTVSDEVETKEEEPSIEVPEEKATISTNDQGTWYESKTDTQESFFWNDTTGASSWHPPDIYLSIEQQREKGLKV